MPDGLISPVYRKPPMSVLASFVVKAIDLAVVTLIFTALT